MRIMLIIAALAFAVVVPTTSQADYETGRPCSEYIGTPDFWICIANQGD